MCSFQHPPVPRARAAAARGSRAEKKHALTERCDEGRRGYAEQGEALEQPQVAYVSDEAGRLVGHSVAGRQHSLAAQPAEREMAAGMRRRRRPASSTAVAPPHPMAGAEAATAMA